MGDYISMPISVDSPSDETLNRGTLALLLRRQYKFPFGISAIFFLLYRMNHTHNQGTEPKGADR